MLAYDDAMRVLSMAAGGVSKSPEYPRTNIRGKKEKWDLLPARHFFVSVRNLTQPQKLYAHGEKLDSLDDWAEKFKYSALRCNQEKSDVHTPRLYPSDRVYSRRFKNANGDPMEVYVAPVSDTQPDVGKGALSSQPRGDGQERGRTTVL